MQSFDPTLIVFAAVAIFVAWKLRSILGVRINVDRKDDSAAKTNKIGDAGANEQKVVRLPGVDSRITAGQTRSIEVYAKSESARIGLNDIIGIDPKFDLRGFLDGAASAYRWIVEAFAKSDRQALLGLLSPELYANFEKEISRREAKGEQSHVRISKIESMEIADARLIGRVAEITTHIEAKISNWTTDKTGSIVGGDPDLEVTTEEFWTFARDLDSNDPNWRLIATEHTSRS